MNKPLPDRKLSEDDLKKFFRVIDSGWNALSWWIEDAYFSNGKNGLKMIIPDNPKLSQEQNYVMVCLATRYEIIIKWICYHFHLSEYQIFERLPSPVYSDYGMAFTFLPEIEDRILAELKAGD